jgi:glycosyltransferase involved in cell wall biosynthesis
MRPGAVEVSLLHVPMTRILQIATHYREPGGEDAVVAAEARLLAGAGHEVIRYRAWNDRNDLKAAAQLAVSSWNPWAARTVRRLVQEHRPQITHVHNTWFALSPSIFRELRRYGAPVLMTVHNYRLVCSNALLFRSGRPCEDCVGSHPWHGVRHRCYRGSWVGSAAAAANIALQRTRGTWVQDVDAFLALNEFSKRRLVAGGIPDEKIILKPNFVDDPGPRANRPSQSGQVLFVGRLSPEKGILELLDAWRRASPRKLRLLVVGDGPLASQARARTDASIRLLGRQHKREVTKLMLSSRALVLPSRWYEVQAVVLLEAMAAGLPVLASDLGGNSEALGAIGSEWLVAPGRVGDWSRALSGLARGSVVDDAGARARSAYRARFTPEVGLRNLERAYSAALDALPLAPTKG